MHEDERSIYYCRHDDHDVLSVAGCHTPTYNMKVGDLVKFDSSLERDVFETSPRIEHGLVVQISKTGHDTTSAQVMFNDGELWWVDSGKLEVVSEGR